MDIEKKKRRLELVPVVIEFLEGLTPQEGFEVAASLLRAGSLAGHYCKKSACPAELSDAVSVVLKMQDTLRKLEVLRAISEN